MLEYVPETVYRVARHFTKAKLTIPIIYVKVGLQAGLLGPSPTKPGPSDPPAFCGFPHSPSLRWSEVSCSLSLFLCPQK